MSLVNIWNNRFNLFFKMHLEIDECIEGKDNCDLTSSDCVNTPGSYKCSCKTGFEMKGSVCVGKCCASVVL